MSPILKKDTTSTLKKRSVSHLGLKIQTAQKNEPNDDKTNTQATQNDSFFQSVWPVIVSAQFLGFMPINGIRTGHPSKFEFRWKSIRVMITMLYFAVGIVVSGLLSRRIVHLGINAKNIVGLVFYSCCLFCGLLFLSLAQKWKALALAWSRCEKVFLNLPYKETGWRLSTKIRITAAVILFLAVLEHLMYIVSSVYNLYMKLKICNAKVDDAWKHFFVSEHPHIFQVLPCNYVFAIFTEWMIISFTFGWNFMDVFVIVTSIGLATRFKQINQRLEELKNEPMQETTRAEIRHDYVTMCDLVELVDKNLAAIILLSSTNNLYFICFQLVNIFNKLPYLINYIYFWYSLLYLIGRATAVFMIASSINDAAKYPIKFVQQRQTSEWCIELERFGDQISTEIVALSGMKFFFITRSLLFGMAGTIVTYELMLLQFDEEKKSTGNVTFCDSI